jgi:hypothetical protein
VADHRIEIDDDLHNILTGKTRIEAEPAPVATDDRINHGIPDDNTVIAERVNNPRWLPRTLQATPEGSERARELQKKSRGPYREARKLRDEQARETAAEILENTKANMEVAAQRAKQASIPKMADDIVRLMAAAVLTGGPQFSPVTGKEATEMAKHWATIRQTYKTGAAMDKLVETTAKDTTEDVVRHLNDLRQRIEARSAQPGNVRQTVHLEDDE